MGMSLAVVSQKGGVGKTTLAANLGAAFADLKFRTLLIEADPQGSLVNCFGLDRFDLHHGLHGCLVNRGNARDAVEKEIQPGLDLLPANVWSHEEERAMLIAVEGNPSTLPDIVAELKPEYDYIILDCPPSLGPLTRNCQASVDRYLVPVQAEAMNMATLGRLEHLAGEVRSSRNPDLRLDGLVVTMADLRTRHACDIVQTLHNDYPRDLLQTIVPRSIKVAEEPVRGRPTVTGSPSSRVGRALQTLAEEILSRHSRERATDEAMDAPEPAVNRMAETGEIEDAETEAWQKVMAEFPEDPPPVSPTTNGNQNWDDLL